VNGGLLDTNVVLHAFEQGSLGGECAAFLRALERGQLQAILDPLVVHELTYALPRFQKQFARNDVANFLIDVVNMPGIVADKELLVETLRLWGTNSGLGFVDAYLVTRGDRESCLVYTKNVRELRALGASVPDRLPADSVP
jgi:predicted nucleic acid-binding protein